MFISTPHPQFTWECKQCHRPISDTETVAYHCLDGVLYGWCEDCFRATQSRRKSNATEQTASGTAAAEPQSNPKQLQIA